MNNFRPVRIGDLGTVITGKTPKTDKPEYYGNDVRFIGPTDLHQHFFIKSSEKMISEAGLNSIKNNTLKGTSILVGCIGWDMGNVAIIEGKCATNQQINAITKIDDSYNPFYIYYWLKNKKDFLFSQASVTRTPILNKTNFSNIEINLPEKSVQDKVANVLTTIDKKIAVNMLLSEKLEAMSKTLFYYWFYQFNFPNEDGLPYSASGGKMVFNQKLKKEIPESWEVVSISELLDIKTGKEDANFANENGNYHFFTCGESTLKCNEYAFDGKAVLLAGNGSFSVKKYQGKFNAYQRTYVLIPENDKLFPCIYFAVKERIKSLTSGSRGSIVKFITKGDIEDIYIPLPKNRELPFISILNASFDNEANLYAENQKLHEIKSWLTPSLLNGQVKTTK